MWFSASKVHKAVTPAPNLDLGASAPFFWDCRTSGSWCCGRVRLKYLIFPFFRPPSALPSYNPAVPMPCSCEWQKGTWCPMKNVSSEADTVWEFYYRDKAWSCNEINMFPRLCAVAGSASQDAGTGVESNLCNIRYLLCWNKEALHLHLRLQPYLRQTVVLKHSIRGWEVFKLNSVLRDAPMLLFRADKAVRSISW